MPRGVIEWVVAPPPGGSRASGCCRWSPRPGTATSTTSTAATSRAEHARGGARRRARRGPVDEGSVGGGTGMNCYAFKGGSGTASRRVAYRPTRPTPSASSCRPTSAAARRADHRRRAASGRALPTTIPDGGRRTGSCRRRARARVHRDRRHRRAAAARAVQGAGPARPARAGAHRHDRLALLRRHLPRLLDRQRRCARQPLPLGPTAARYERLHVLPWGRIDPFYERRRPGDRGGRRQCPGRAETMVGLDGHRSPALPHEALAAVIADGAA